MLSSQGKVRDFPIAILATPGGRSLAESVDRGLRELCKENGQLCPRTFIRQSENPRFQNGEGKGMIQESIRGTDLYVFVDVNNYGVTYTRYGEETPLTPDEHFQDLKRLLGATRNVVQRTTIVMPLLYEGRQHKIHGRESLDCALMLQELMHMGVHAVMTLDAHNSHVHNAIPLHCFENLHATYQLISAFLEETRGIVDINPDTLLVCSPDLGGMERARYFAEHFRVHLSGFYKVRDLTKIVDGKNPVLEQAFLGASDLEGKDVLIVDDMLASGGSMLEVADELKRLGANRIYMTVTFGLFSSGIDIFDEAYKAGKIERVFATNGCYFDERLRDREWFCEVDVTRFMAKFIHTFNQDGSVSKLLDSTEKISRLLGRSLPDRDGVTDATSTLKAPTVSIRVGTDELTTP